MITNLWREEIAYGAAGTRDGTVKQVLGAARRIYSHYPEIFEGGCSRMNEFVFLWPIATGVGRCLKSRGDFPQCMAKMGGAARAACRSWSNMGR